LGACQVRLQLSTLFVLKTTRANFCVAKFSSFVAFEQEKTPVRAPAPSALRKPAAARSSASSQLASRSSPFSRTRGVVSLACLLAMLGDRYGARVKSDGFRAAAESKDFSQLEEIFAEDVTFRSPAVFKPYVGRDAVGMILTTVAQVFEDFRYTDQV